MAHNNRNEKNQKGNEKENRTGNDKQNTGYHKLPDNPENDPTDTVSTAGDTSNGKYSRTNKRDEDIDNDDTRGGR